MGARRSTTSADITISPEIYDLALAVSMVTAKLQRQQRQRLTGHAGAGTPARLAALSVIEQDGPLTISDLAAAEGTHPSTMTGIVHALQKLGYLTRTVDDRDRRAILLEITKEGRRALTAARRESHVRLARGIERLSPNEQQQLAGAISVLEKLLVADPSHEV